MTAAPIFSSEMDYAPAKRQRRLPLSRIAI